MDGGAVETGVGAVNMITTDEVVGLIALCVGVPLVVMLFCGWLG